MSKSSRTPHLKTRKSRKRVAVPAAAPTPTPAHRRRSGSVDYRPAVRAARDLTVWALGLAAREVADHPEGVRRVRAVRRFILDALRGHRPAVMPANELMFTANVLGRIFKLNERVSATELLSFCEQMRIVAELLPMMLHTQCPARAPLDPRRVPPMPPITPLRPRPGAGGAQPVPSSGCAECSPLGLPFRFAA